MKRFLTMFFILLGLAANAKGQDVYVLPLFMNGETAANAYGFETASEIFAGDIIRNFLLGTKVNSTKLSSVKALHSNDIVLSQIADKYRKTGVIDFEKLISVSGKDMANKTLLVASFVEDVNGNLLEPWDVMKFASVLNIDSSYFLTTKVMLVDNKDGVLLWQKSYEMPLTSANKPFTAVNYTKAVEQYEKLRSYSKNVVAKDVEQNLNLRFGHKTINYAKNIKNQPNASEGIGLKYYKQGGVPTVKITQPEETFEQQLLREDSFSL